MLSGPDIEKASWTLPNGEVVRFPAGLRQEAALRLVQPGERLLDVGCGRGAVAAALRDRFDEVHGVDADPAALEVAAGRGVNTAAVDLDRGPLPYADGAFDALLALEVVEHVLDPDAFARELARVLRPGGRLYLSTPNVRFAGYLRELVLRGRFPLTSKDPWGWQGGHIHFFTFADVEELLQGAGFDDVRHEGITSAAAARSLRFRALGLALGRRLARELLHVGIFTTARRGPGPVPARPPVERRPRSD